MIISINWIRDYVRLPEAVLPQLAQKFTLATCEVESVTTVNEALSKVIVVEILRVQLHPNADRLHLVTIQTGSGEKVIVCGAPNARPGIKVPYAPNGTVLPGGITLCAKSVRGVLSEGMLCSEAELQIGSDDTGIKELPPQAPVGATLADFLHLPADILFDIDNKSLTNRPDLWSHLGMAREFATVFKEPLSDPYNADWEARLLALIPSTPNPIRHTVSPDSACKGYWGLSVSGIRVTESPQWMQQRLLACGMRPINSIVDISNYVLLELGIPNHIFDLNKIRGAKIEVKRPQSDLVFTTLDEQERTLTPQDTLIWDAEGPVAIAGVMGGLHSGISDTTTAVFIESANFSAAEIRKTANRIGLRTDASLRYEKSLDTRLLKRTSLRILELLLQLNPKAQVMGALDYAGEDLNTPLPVITVPASRFSQVLGMPVKTETVTDILSRLGFTVRDNNGLLSVTVPSYRATKDIEGEADLIEEIGRILGYDCIVPTPPFNAVSPVSLSNAQKTERRLADFMIYKQKAFEIMTYPMIGRALLDKTCWDDANEPLQLLSAISPDRDRMRPSLVPSLIEALQLNSKQKSRFTFYEIGRAYRPDPKTFSTETTWFGAVFYDRKENRIADAVNCAEEIISLLNLNGKVTGQPAADLFPVNWPGFHPFENLQIQLFGQSAGAVVSLHPLFKAKLKIKGHAALLLLNLSLFENNPIKDKTAYKPLPRFPGSEFDCTVIAPKATPAADLVGVIKKLKLKSVTKVAVADIFFPSDTEKAVTLRTHFLNPEKTLDSAFLETAQHQIVAALTQAGFPLKQ